MTGTVPFPTGTLNQLLSEVIERVEAQLHLQSERDGKAVETISINRGAEQGSIAISMSDESTDTARRWIEATLRGVGQ